MTFVLSNKYTGCDRKSGTIGQEVIPYAKINQKCGIKFFHPGLCFRENYDIIIQGDLRKGDLLEIFH